MMLKNNKESKVYINNAIVIKLLIKIELILKENRGTKAIIKRDNIIV